MLKKLWFWFLRGKPQTFRPVILVTGCGSGIGLSLARLLSRQTQYRVVITARRKTLPSLKARFVEDERFWIRPLDITSAEDREALLSEINAVWGGVNVLVNNAGISYRAVVEHMDAESELHQMDTNYLGPMALIRLVLPHLRERGRGKIINVSSVSGMLAMPTMASYSASKYALEGACEALWYEAKPYGIDVSLIQPGFIRSNSFQNVYRTEKAKQAAGGPYADYYANMGPFVEKMMGRSLTRPEHIARVVLRTIQKENPPLWIPATIDAWVFYYLRRWVPRRLLLPLLFHLLPNARRWGQNHTRKRDAA